MIHKETLPNGVRVVVEPIPHVRSVSLGIWVATGSRHEEPVMAGVSHLVEHLLFKGTARRTAKELAEVLEAVGGQLNAFTSKEYTCYYAKVLDEHFDLALDVLTDMFFNSKFDGTDVERERRVVLEEISMYEDSPDELVHDLLAESIWAENPLGRPILGSVETVTVMEREQIIGYFRREYEASRTVIAIAGAFDPVEVVDKVKVVFAGMSPGKGLRSGNQPVFRAQTKFRQKDVEQVQICLGTAGLPQEHPDIYALHVLNNVLGGGASSRLFQEIREQRGLAYSVYTYHAGFSDAGIFGVYAGTSPDYCREVLDVIVKEMAQIKQAGITAAELRRTQDQIKGSLYLGLESVNSRMVRLGKSEVAYNRYVSPEEVIDRIYQVTLADVLRVARTLWPVERCSLAIIGAVDPRVDFAGLAARHGL